MKTKFILPILAAVLVAFCVSAQVIKYFTDYPESTSVGNTDVLPLQVGTGYKHVRGSNLVAQIVAAAITNGWLNVKNFGATGNGVTDDTAALQTAHNTALATTNGLIMPWGKYLISRAITNRGVSLFAPQAELVLKTNCDAYVIDSLVTNTVVGNLLLYLPTIYKYPGFHKAWQTNDGLADCGIRIRSLSHSEVHLQQVYDFTWGVDMCPWTGLWVGYNAFYGGYVLNNKTNFGINPESTNLTTGGWVNHNTFHSISMTHTDNLHRDDVVNVGISQPHVIDGANDMWGHAPYNLMFDGCALEGGGGTNLFKVQGSHISFLFCWYESDDQTANPVSVLFQTNNTTSTDNVLLFGANSELLHFSGTPSYDGALTMNSPVFSRTAYGAQNTPYTKANNFLILGDASSLSPRAALRFPFAAHVYGTKQDTIMFSGYYSTNGVRSLQFGRSYLDTNNGWMPEFTIDSDPLGSIIPTITVQGCDKSSPANFTVTGVLGGTNLSLRLAAKQTQSAVLDNIIVTGTITNLGGQTGGTQTFSVGPFLTQASSANNHDFKLTQDATNKLNMALTNLNGAQPTNNTLTLLAGTGAITNINSVVSNAVSLLYTSNATTLLKQMSNGANVTITDNGTHLVIASTGGGGPSTSNNIPGNGSYTGTNFICDAGATNLWRLLLTKASGFMLTNGIDGQLVDLQITQDGTGGWGCITNPVGTCGYFCFGKVYTAPLVVDTNAGLTSYARFRYWAASNRWDVIGGTWGF